MPLDMVKVMFQDNLGAQSMDGVYDILRNAPSSNNNGMYAFQVKSEQGFPIDFHWIDDNGVYDSGTELDKEGWKNPASVKLSLANGTRGRLMCPRYVEGGFPFAIENAESSYLPFANGITDRVPRNVGLTKYSWDIVP